MLHGGGARWAGNFSPDSVSVSATTAADTIAPSTPAGLVASPAGKSAINLTWSASTDNVGVTGYIVNATARSGHATTTSYADTLLSSATTYSYTVAARDAAGNISLDSASVSATTADTLFPLHTEAGKRYLGRRAAILSLMLGESPQAMIGELSEADAEVFLANRKSTGSIPYGSICWCASYTGCSPDGITVFDSLAPFTVGSDLSTYDLSQPNELYFARATTYFSWRKIWLPCNPGPGRNRQLAECPTEERPRQVLCLRAVSRHALQGLPNIVWMSGNDFQGWRTFRAMLRWCKRSPRHQG